MIAEMQSLIGEKQLIHCFHVGKCTAHRSPGYFAHVTDASGNLQFRAEADSMEKAMRQLLDRIVENRIVKPNVLPGMTTPPPFKMPGIG